MADTSEMLKLVERVEALEGPDREVDYLIADAVLGPVKPPYRRGHCEKYTASLDAALTLVPEGFAWILYSDGPTYMASAEIGKHPRGGELTQGDWVGEAETPTLALCVAALCARHHLETSNDRHP